MAHVRATTEERRTAILQAACEVFSTAGLERAHVDEIARRARVGKGTIYQHWESKEDLFLAVARHLCDRNVERITGLLEAEVDPREGLSVLFRELVTSIEQFIPVLGLYLETWTLACSREDLRERCIATFRELYVPVMKLVSRYVEEGQRAGHFADHPPEDVASLLVATVDGLAYQALFILDPARLPGMAHAAERLLFAGLDTRS